ncbi:MAG TPA: catalase family peroxidase [Polyangiaceae bacterium]|nr:catalase family peroxidase [Polyangiaceae bacterium]
MKTSSSKVGLVSGAAAVAAIAIAANPSSTFGQAAPSAKKAPDATVTTPETFVDALNFAFGKQTTQRATHAKGVVLLGSFTPSAKASSVSKAPHFKQQVPVTVRFSANTGLPKLADAAPLANPRGMAIKFHLPDGTETDLVTHSYNGFPTGSADEQRQFFIAVGSSGPGTPSPTPLEKFLTTHPAAKTFLTTQDPPPVSYGTTSYFGVNSFKFTNATGQSTFGRYQLLPVAGRHYLSKEEAAKADPDYLTDEIRKRVTHGPVQFKLVLQFAAPGDKIDDPSVAWSDKNEHLDLGVLAVATTVPDSPATERGLLFLPGVLPVGIEPADPMITFRSKAYPVSYERRQHP